MNTEEGNKLIAEFMGGEFFTDVPDGMLRVKNIQPNKNTSRFLYSLEYHSSWDWLMPVVEKIKKENFDNWIYIPQSATIDMALMDVNKKNLWQAITQFIEWYNKEQGVKESNTSKAT
jgi:hypothetical protein